MTSRVVLSIRIDAAPDAVFDAFVERIGDWWVHDDAFRFTPRSPGRLSFDPPGPDGAGGRLIETLESGKVFEIGAVSIWLPGERLVVGWRQATFGPDHATEVEVRFEAVGHQTRVTVEHRGWDSLPQSHVARHGLPLTTNLALQGRHWRASLSGLSVLAAPPLSGSAAGSPAGSPD